MFFVLADTRDSLKGGGRITTGNRSPVQETSDSGWPGEHEPGHRSVLGIAAVMVLDPKRAISRT